MITIRQEANKYKILFGAGRGRFFVLADDLMEVHVAIDHYHAKPHNNGICPLCALEKKQSVPGKVAWTQIGNMRFRGDTGTTYVYVECKLHVGSPTVSNWVCADYTQQKYLEGTNHKGYKTMQGAKRAAEKAVGKL